MILMSLNYKEFHRVSIIHVAPKNSYWRTIVKTKTEWDQDLNIWIIIVPGKKFIRSANGKHEQPIDCYESGKEENTVVRKSVQENSNHRALLVDFKLKINFQIIKVDTKL